MRSYYRETIHPTETVGRLCRKTKPSKIPREVIYSSRKVQLEQKNSFYSSRKLQPKRWEAYRIRGRYKKCHLRGVAFLNGLCIFSYGIDEVQLSRRAKFIICKLTFFFKRQISNLAGCIKCSKLSNTLMKYTFCHQLAFFVNNG